MASTAQAITVKPLTKPIVRLQASVASFEEDGKLLGLAREIAMDIQSIDVILANHGMSAQRFAEVQKLPRFVQYMEHEVLAWNTSLNASQRVKVKSITLIEEWLSHLNQEMHAPTSTLAAKVEAGKLVARLGGLGLNVAATATEAGEQFSVTINMGDDKQVKIGMTKPVSSGQGGQNVGGSAAGRDEYDNPVDDDGYSYSYKEDRVYEDNGNGARKVTLGKSKGSSKNDSSVISWATTGDKWAEIVNAELGAGDM